MSQEENWRIRCDVIDILVYLVRELGEDFMNYKFILDKIIVSYLEDHVYKVREKAIGAVKSFGESVGKKWVNKTALPIFFKFINEKGYDYALRQNFTNAVVVSFFVWSIDRNCRI